MQGCALAPWASQLGAGGIQAGAWWLAVDGIPDPNLLEFSKNKGSSREARDFLPPGLTLSCSLSDYTLL